MNSKNVFFVVAILAIVFFSGALLIKSDSSSLNLNENDLQGNFQTAKLYVQGANYIMEPSEFKVGVPVRLQADYSRVPGCAKSIVIPAFGIQETITQNDNIITFTPDKAGTFNIACSMNMYKGSFTVIE